MCSFTLQEFALLERPSVPALINPLFPTPNINDAVNAPCSIAREPNTRKNTAFDSIILQLFTNAFQKQRNLDVCSVGAGPQLLVERCNPSKCIWQNGANDAFLNLQWHAPLV